MKISSHETTHKISHKIIRQKPKETNYLWFRDEVSWKEESTLKYVYQIQEGKHLPSIPNFHEWIKHFLAHVEVSGSIVESKGNIEHSPSRNNRHNPVSHMEDVTSSNTRTHARTRVRTTPAQRREETESLARISQPRDPVDRARAAANATAFVFTGAAGGLPMRHVGLPQLAVFVRPLF